MPNFILARTLDLLILLLTFNLVARPVHYLIDLAHNLGVYWIFFSLLLFLLHLSKLFRHLRWHTVRACLFFLLAILYFIPIANYYLPQASVSFCAKPNQKNCAYLTLLLVHLPAKASEQQLLNQLLIRTQPNILGIIGYTENTSTTLPDLKHFRSKVEIPRNDGVGLALFSTEKLGSDITTSIGDETPPVISTTIGIDVRRPVQILLFQALPISADALNINKLIFRRLVTPLKHSADEGIILGSMNATPYSSFLRPFFWAADFNDVFFGRGLQRTWYAESSLLRFNFDQVLFRGDFSVLDARVLENIGSPHLPILTTLGYQLAARSAPAHSAARELAKE